MNRWPHQTYAAQEIPRCVNEGIKRICLTSPTGGGKSVMTVDAIEWLVGEGYFPVVYTNRILLREQLVRVLRSHGIDVGIRAAGEKPEFGKRVQVSSLPTEASRVLKKNEWFLHGAGGKAAALIDEAHINAGAVAEEITRRHVEDGGLSIGITATPIDLAHMYDHLIVAGNMTELRKCGALVEAHHIGVDEPDMRHFKTSVKTGEYKEGDVVKAIMTKCIFARVIDNYQTINPEQRPTILFGPGVKESIWFAEQFTAAGIRAAHIDGEGVWVDGEYHRGTDRDQILSDVRSGRIKVVCNRFVLREGLDLPEVSHLILATVMGSLTTYLQSAGRGLRACKGKTHLTIQDHGGHWHRCGSVNIDREWALGVTESQLHALRNEGLRSKSEPEPIRCPACGFIRQFGSVCIKCNHEHQKSSRIVIQQDGRLVEHKGDIYRARRTDFREDTIKHWTSCVHGGRRSGKTFRAARAWFYQQHKYWPPQDIPLMPMSVNDWVRKIKDVPFDRLTSQGVTAANQEIPWGQLV